MTKGNTFENDLVLLLFNGIPINGLADVGVADPLTVLYLSLHTAILTEADNQGISESTYTGYVRMPLSRTSAGWTVASGVAQNAVDVIFPASANDDLEIVALAIGQEETGPGKIFHYGPLFEPLHIHTGFTPTFQAGSIRAGEE